MNGSNPGRHRIRRIATGLILLVLPFIYFNGSPFSGQVISSNGLIYQWKPFDQMPGAASATGANPLLADQPQQFHAYHKFIIDSVGDGILPLWIPYILCGNSFAGNIQAQTWYPFTYLGLLMPLPLSETTTKVLETILSALGMVLFLRRAFGVSLTASLTGAIAFSFCAYRIVWLNHPHSSSLTYLPWLLWAVTLIAKNHDRVIPSISLTALFTYLAIAGGHPQTFILVIAGSALFGICHVLFTRDNATSIFQPVPTISYIISGILLGIIVAAVILFPFADALFSDSFTYGDRAGAARGGILPTRAFWVALFPSWFGSPLTGDDHNIYNYNENALFIGITTLWLACASLPYAIRTFGYRYFLTLAVVIVCTLCGLPIVSPLIREIPIIRDMPIMRISAWLQFSLIVCAAMGLHQLTKSAPEPSAKRHVAWLVTGSLLLSALIVYGMLTSSGHPAGMRILIPLIMIWLYTFVVMRSRVISPLLAALAPITIFAELYMAHANYNPRIPLQTALIEEPALVSHIKETEKDSWFRITALDGTLTPNLGVLFGVHDIRGYDLPMKRRYVEFLSHAFYGGTWKYGMIYWHAGGSDFIKEENLPLVALLGIKHIMLDGHSIPTTGIMKPYPYVYALTNPKYSSGSISGDVEKIRSGSNELVELPAGMLPEGSGTSRIRIVDRSPNGVVFQAVCERETIVAINEMPISGWRAAINGKSSPAFPVNVVHTGVLLPAGDNLVSLRFLPGSFTAGLAVTTLTVSGLLAANVIGMVQRRRQSLRIHQGAGAGLPSGTVPR